MNEFMGHQIKPIEMGSFLNALERVLPPRRRFHSVAFPNAAALRSTPKFVDKIKRS